MRLGRKKIAQTDPQKGALSGALMASLVAFAVGGVFLGIAYWDIVYHLIVAAVLLSGLKMSAVLAFQSAMPFLTQVACHLQTTKRSEERVQLDGRRFGSRD